MKVQKSLRWMLVDDDQAVLAVMGEVLAAISNAEVVCFNSPYQAIQAFREDPCGYDLVISDFDMPGLDGLEMCHVLRAITPDLKTILATGNSQITAEYASAEGFNALLHKPFTVSALQATLKAVQTQQSQPTPALLEAA